VVVNVPAQLRRRRHLNDDPARRQRKIWVTSALVAALVLLTFLGSLFWSYRYHSSIAARSNAVTAALPSSKSLETPVVGTPSTAVASDAPAAPSDRDPVANAAAPADADGPKPRIDPRSLRNLVDRGVAGYASARTDADRARAASEIQTAASAGFPSARVLLARNYPQSAAIRSIVPAKDVVRYALALLADPASENDDTKQIFLALGLHFASHGKLDLFATQILDSMRRDSRPQLYHRIDILLDMLDRVPGSCAALARLIASPPDRSDQECSLSLSERLRRDIDSAISARAR
jgi:hypothetical protein